MTTIDDKPSTGLYITDSYPDLETVNAQLYPEASSLRPTIDEYAHSLELRGRLTPIVAEAIEKAKAVREATDTIVYIAGGLTGVSEELKSRYGHTSDLLATYPPVPGGKPQAFFGYAPHLHGTDPVKHPDVTSDEVRDVDFLWAVIVADIHVNFLDPTAHGNAIEEGWAESRLIPTVYLNPDANRLSRLTLGMHNVVRKILYQEFMSGETDEQDLSAEAVGTPAGDQKTALEQAKIVFDELHAWMRAFPNRDPREFHYVSFASLATVADRSVDKEPRNGYSIEELVSKFDSHGLAVYVKDPGNKHYGKTGYIDFASDWKGLGVITEDGYPFLFDPLTVGASLSFWPVLRDSELTHRPIVKSDTELLEDPLFDFGDVYGRQYSE